MAANQPREAAIDALEALGLTESEARCFVALTQLPQGTAREVSTLADIPRARVYDLAERLSDRGLVAVQDTSPKAFQAVSIETAIEILETRYQDQLSEAAEALQSLERSDEAPTDEGIWTITGSEAIMETVIRLIDEAEEEILIIHADERIGPNEDVTDSLKAAQDRGVRIIAGSTLEEVRELGREQLSDAIIFEPRLGWEEDSTAGGIGQILMVDRDAILGSAIEEGPVAAMTEELAIWGRNSGFNKVLGPILEQRVEAILARREEPT